MESHVGKGIDIELLNIKHFGVLSKLLQLGKIGQSSLRGKGYFLVQGGAA